jgi:cytochrome c biogenesis protein
MEIVSKSRPFYLHGNKERDKEVKKTNKGEPREHKEDRKEKTNILSSLRLTIPLLILLAALSIIGTVITQNATEQEYLQRYSKETYYILKGFGLLDMYHSFWFMGVLILLAINLIACSVKRLPGVWRQVRRTRSNYGRLGTYLTHLSVLIILVGALVGALWGFKGYVEIREGETVDSFVLNGPEAVVKPLGFQVRCDAFHVDFYPDGSPHEFLSTLTFLNKGKVIIDHAPLRVNHPISYEGLSFYQSSYGTSAETVIEVRGKGGKGAAQIVKLGEGDVKPIPGTDAGLGLMQYEERIHGNEGGILLVLIAPHASPQSFWLLTGQRIKQGSVHKGDFTFTLKALEKKNYTGIQVAHDPGLPVVWTGCVLLVIGLVVTFTLRKPSKGKAAEER